MPIVVSAMQPSFRPVPPQVSFPELEQRILAYWRENSIVEAGLRRNEGAEEWVFYEGPPTANGKPGVHHVLARIVKDIFPRFQVMRGRFVPRRAGWDCHGLPVELEIEKELRISGKQQIEEFGIDRFNARCRESVLRYVKDWERLTERIAFWISMDDPYLTMSAEYVDSVWWSLKRLYEEGLLFQDYRSAPYCPRCETVLSNHELDYPGSYQTVEDPSVFVRFPLTDEEADLLIWTTTPWTLPSNLAVAVHPEVSYSKVASNGGRPVILAAPLVERVMGPEATVLETLKAERLTGRRYEPPFRFVEPEKPAWFVIAEEFVTVSDGTGVVHMAPAFGAEDLEAGKKHGLPFVNLVDKSGRFVAEAGPLAGLGVKEADPKITADLSQRGLLFRAETYEHSYPHCWRCNTPLLYYAKTSWYVKTTARKEELLDQNQKTNWYPETIKHGRYGEWLRNNVDWALSRDRYWGTPLPIWRCPNEHPTVVGSRKELSERVGQNLDSLDPHRPFVDEVRFPCPDCGETTERVPEVIDAWYDSGSMPFAQWGYPLRNRDLFERRFPADFIAEGLDQTRGWFYTLMACATLLFGQNSYRNVICHGLLIDAEGRKMSKSLGNVIDPWTILEAQGADALRWYLFTSGSPWVNRRVGLTQIQEFLRRYLITLWNTYSFFVTYANIDGFDPKERRPVPAAERPELDRWILAELNDTVREVTESLESYDALRGGRRLDALVDDLSNWFVRRSRRRFWRSGSDPEKLSGYDTLYECLVTLSKLTAPFTPFVAEEIFTNLTGKKSVHLEDWPVYEEAVIDERLRERMRTARLLVSLGRAARSEGKIKTRQPLPRALVSAPSNERTSISEMAELIVEELNVKELEFVDSLEEFVDYSLRPDWRRLGPRFGSQIHAIAAAIENADPLEVLKQLASEGKARFVVDGEEIWLDAQDLDLRAEERKGFAVAHEGSYGVALDLSITPELRLEGLAREIVRGLNESRRQAGLDISDRIELYLGAEGEVAQAITAHRDWIAGEVLASKMLDAPPGDGFSIEMSIDGYQLEVAFSRSPEK
jgi:isoleucyl-tRNA synthetase